MADTSAVDYSMRLPGTGRAPGWGTHLFVIAGYVLLAAAVTWPLAPKFTSQVVAEHYFDRAQNMWNLWWVKVALLDQHTNPFHTNMLLFPQGIDLYFHALDLPSGLLTLAPLLLFGLAAAYNSSLFFALVLSAYAGFRLALYLTGNTRAAVVAGVIIGFNPLSLAMLRSQINIASLQWFVLCIECLLRAWFDGSRRAAALAGLFLGLAVLTVGYFEVHLLFFLIAFLVWAFVTAPGSGWRSRLVLMAKQARSLALWGGGMALVVVGPYALGAWRSLQKGQIVPWSAGDSSRVVLNSLDLLSYVVPNRNHWLLGSGAPWWSTTSTSIHDYAYLGVFTLALAILGLAWLRGRAGAWLWLSLAILGAVLALGPVLRVNGGSPSGPTDVPMPFALLQSVPVVGLVRAPERFVTLTFLSLGIISAFGVCSLEARLAGAGRRVLLPGLLALLLIELPLHSRHLEPVDIPGSLAALAGSTPGALLELPLTQHGKVDANRMLYQTAHGIPITSAYLSRDLVDPYEDACSPFHPFRGTANEPTTDIVTPTATSRLTPGFLVRNGVGYIAVYKKGFLESDELEPLPEPQLRSLNALAGKLGTRFSDDESATVYRVRPDTSAPGRYLEIGPSWYDLQESYSQPFRWISGGRADVCVFSPGEVTAPLVFQATSYARPRSLQVWVGGQKVVDQQVPADGALHEITTPPVTWPRGPYRVTFAAPGGTTSPASLGQGKDERGLSLGFSMIRVQGPKR